MKNKEFFKDKLIEIAIDHMAVNKHTGEVEVCEYIPCENCLFYGKDCRDMCYKWLSEEYAKPVLDKGEKMYLEGTLRPFKDRIESISKEFTYNNRFDNLYERLVVKLSDNNRYYVLPKYIPGIIYKGMKIYKDYTIEELGLFQDGGSDEE